VLGGGGKDSETWFCPGTNTPCGASPALDQQV